MADPNNEVISIPLSVEEIRYFLRVMEKNMKQAVNQPSFTTDANQIRAYKTVKLYEKFVYALQKLGVQK